MNVPPSPSMIFPHVMNQPESPHQAAIAGRFAVAKAPELMPQAQQLVTIYDGTFGASGPYCCPAALAAVLDQVAGLSYGEVADLAAMLRGEQP